MLDEIKIVDDYMMQYDFYCPIFVSIVIYKLNDQSGVVELHTDVRLVMAK